MSIRVLVADDQALIRSGLVAFLAPVPDIEVVGEAADGDEALRLTGELRPDVVLMDIRMPGLDGLEATRRICADPELSGARIIVLTTFEMDDHVFAALRAGASGFLGKGVDPDDLVAAVRVVAGGDALLSPKATRSLIERHLAQPSAVLADASASVLDVLTEREREVVALLAHGMSGEDIAARLVLSPLTVKTHVNRAMAKLRVRDRVQLVVLAYQCGLVRVGEGRP